MKEGCHGSDVTAVQRALYVALGDLGGHGTNAKNGDYGGKTIADVKSYQKRIGLEQTGTVGDNTLQALWQKHSEFPAGSLDPYGVSLVMKADVGDATKLPDPIKKGNHGKRCEALQRHLHGALGNDATNSRNGEFGDKTQADLKLYLQRADWDEKPRDKVGQEVWDALWAFGDDYSHQLAKNAGGGSGSPDQIRADIRTWGEWYVRNKSQIKYAQIRPYPKSSKLPMKTDCSGSSTHILFMAGAPTDPHGRGWDGQGYTGTCQGRGKKVGFADVEPGDCCFYGDQGGGVSSHMVIVIGPNDRALNFGADPPHYVYIGSYWLSARRGDIGARRYF